jgi:hypothetical protein
VKVIATLPVYSISTCHAGCEKFRDFCKADLILQQSCILEKTKPASRENAGVTKCIPSVLFYQIAEKAVPFIGGTSCKIQPVLIKDGFGGR